MGLIFFRDKFQKLILRLLSVIKANLPIIDVCLPFIA
jgi:hypothetical protein